MLHVHFDYYLRSVTLLSRVTHIHEWVWHSPLGLLPEVRSFVGVLSHIPMSCVTLLLRILLQIRSLEYVVSHIWMRTTWGPLIFMSRVTYMHESCYTPKLCHTYEWEHVTLQLQLLSEVRPLKPVCIRVLSHSNCSAWAPSSFNLDYYLRSAPSYESCHVYTWVVQHCKVVSHI